MKKRNKRLIYIILCLFILSSMIISCFAQTVDNIDPDSPINVGGYGDYYLAAYHYDTDINNISYQILIDKRSLYNLSDDWGFIDYCLSIMGLQYNQLNVTNDNSDTLETLPAYVNSGQAFAYDRDNNYSQTNYNLMIEFITDFNKICGTYKHTLEFNTQFTFRLNQVLRDAIFKNVDVILKFLLTNNLINNNDLYDINNNIKNYQLFATDTAVISNNEFSYYNVINTSGNYYNHIKFDIKDISNSIFDIEKSKNFLLDVANWSFLPTIISNIVLGCISAIVVVGTTMGIFSLVKKVI